LGQRLGTRRELEDLRRLVIRVAGEAAAYLRDRFGLEELLATKGIHSYDSDDSMVIDYEGEEHVIELLRSEGFRGIFVGEEHGSIKLGDDPLVAVVDPLDGSKNYASMIPWSSVSIALAPLPEDREPVLRDVLVGAVAPILPMPVLSFAKGVGAFEGGARIHATPRSKRLVLAYFEELDQARVVHEYLGLVGGKRSVRALGSASLEIAWVGMGRADVFIDVRGRLRVVDVAAAVGFAKEAGAIVSVENLEARLTRVERVGSVLVASTKESWSTLVDALKRTGFPELAANVL
jgi:myo-inositol-1(or 4)-monophosphatase